MSKAIRNLDYIRAKDPRLYEALSDLIQQHQNVAQQVNGNPVGGPLPPPSIDGVNVTGQNGHFHIQIQHLADIYRGIQYYAEFADNAGFTSPHVIHMGDSREHTQFLGDGTYYWRAYAAYASSPASAPAYHGGAVSPQPVSGGGNVGGPALLPPQGSGTGRAGEGLSGPGPVAFRSLTGVPPKRGQSSGGGASGSGGGGMTPSPATGLPEGLVSLGTVSGDSGSGAISESLIAQSEWLTGVAGTNAITATTAIPYQSLSVGFMVRLVPVNSNTGAVTLSVNGIAAAAVTKNGSTALVGGELQANQTCLLLWDGTRWQIVNVAVDYGTYTPAVVAVNNISGSPSAGVFQWLRVGLSVTVSGRVTLQPTAGAATCQLGIPLPIASNFGNADQAAGAGVSAATGYSGAVVSDSTNKRAELDAPIPAAGDTSSHNWWLSFTYQIV